MERYCVITSIGDTLENTLKSNYFFQLFLQFLNNYYEISLKILFIVESSIIGV